MDLFLVNDLLIFAPRISVEVRILLHISTFYGALLETSVDLFLVNALNFDYITIFRF